MINSIRELGFTILKVVGASDGGATVVVVCGCVATVVVVVGGAGVVVVVVVADAKVTVVHGHHPSGIGHWTGGEVWGEGLGTYVNVLLVVSTGSVTGCVGKVFGAYVSGGSVCSATVEIVIGGA